MPQKIVICCDGTWNTPRTETNIFRTYDFLRQSLVQSPTDLDHGGGVRVCHGQMADGTTVSAFYDAGVGTNFFDRLAGGATGFGLSKNVCDAYHFLAHTFTPEAEIYVFGFSRGAYTARSLCGFIKVAALLAAPSPEDVYRAYLDYYATKRVIARPRGWSLDSLRTHLLESFGNLVDHSAGPNLDHMPRHAGVRIHFIGVYDTVGALGVPLPSAMQVNEAVVGFHDTSISDLIEHAVHVLAIDEKRGPYLPTLWTLAPGQTLMPTQSVCQVWFPGVHSDVGGGYHDKGIGDYTLRFMLQQAAAHGLGVDPEHCVPTASLQALPAQHESFNGTWRVLSDQLNLIPDGQRALGTTVAGPDGTTLQVAGTVGFHALVEERFGRLVDVILDEETQERRTQEYRPPNAVSGLLPTVA